MSDKSLQAIQDVVRQPWYQYENATRGTDLDSYKDQLIVNMIPEKMMDFSTETIKTQLAKRPGLYSDEVDYISFIVPNPDASTVRDFICITALFDVFVVAIFDEIALKFYIIQVRPIAQTAHVIGAGITAATDDNIYLSEISQTSAGSLVPGLAINIVKSDYSSSTGYYAVSAAGSLSAVLNTITDVGYPANQTPALIPIGKFINQRGTFYIATIDGTLWNSYPGQNDINSWRNATLQIGSVKVNVYPDQCLGIERIKNNIIAFSRNSIEFFQEVGPSVNNPSSLAPMDQAFIKFGAIKQELIKNVDDVLYWVAYGQDGQSGLWRLDGYTPVKLSTPYIDSQIAATAENLNTYIFNLQSCVMNGKRQIFINGLSGHGILGLTDSSQYSSSDTYRIDTFFDSRTTAFVYNVDDKAWWGFNTGLDTGAVVRFATSFASPSQGNLYTQFAWLNVTTSSLTPFCFKIRTDNSFFDQVSVDLLVPVCAYVQTNSFWFDNEKRKRISKFKIITNTVPIQSSDDASIYTLYFIYNKSNLGTLDASLSFTDTWIRSISNPPTSGRYVFNNLGMSRVWDFAIVDKSGMNLRLHSFELDIQQGSH